MYLVYLINYWFIILYTACVYLLFYMQSMFLFNTMKRMSLVLRPKSRVAVQNRLPAFRSSSRLRWQHGVLRCPRPNMWTRNTQIWLGNQSSHPGASIYLVRPLGAALRRAAFWAGHRSETCPTASCCIQGLQLLTAGALRMSCSCQGSDSALTSRVKSEETAKYAWRQVNVLYQVGNNNCQ